jgi:hypothetical protein
MITKIKLLHVGLVIVAALSIQSIYSNNIITVENRLNKRINIVARFRACKISVFNVEPGSTRQENAYGCCITDQVEIYELNDNGTRTHRACLFYPRTTGASISCADNHIVVQEAGPNDIVATRPEDA